MDELTRYRVSYISYSSRRRGSRPKEDASIIVWAPSKDQAEEAAGYVLSEQMGYPQFEIYAVRKAPLAEGESYSMPRDDYGVLSQAFR